MRERVEKILAQIKEQLDKLSKKQKKLIVIGLVVILVFAAAVTVFLNSKPYEPLYYELNEQEVTEIAAKLTELGVTYKISGNVISVPSEEVDQVKANMASQGYPKSGLSYDTFTNNVDIMTGASQIELYKVYALQDRLAATICYYDGVKDAVVEIALGEQKKYVQEKDKVESTAGVTVIMKDGGSPTLDQVKGIQRLVAAAVPGLKRDNVTVVDGNGNAVSETGDGTQSNSAQLKRSLEIEIENSTKAKIMGLLEPVFGEDYIRISVNADVNVDKSLKEILNYSPSTQDNKGVISKESQGMESSTGGGMAGGVPGAETNADVPIYPGVTYNNGELYVKDQKDFDYLVSQMKEQVQSDSGMLEDLTVSATVDSAKLDARKMAELKTFIGNAAGIDPNLVNDKVAILAAKFNAQDKESPLGFLEAFKANPLKYIPFIIGGLALLTVIIVAIILLLKKKKKVVEETEDKALKKGVMSIDVEDIKASVQEIPNTRETELKNEIRDFADANPEISAALIKTWLRGEEDGN